MFVTYKLSEKSFNKLQKKGLSEAALNDLAELKSRVFPSPEVFLNRVRKLPQAEEILKKESIILLNKIIKPSPITAPGIA